MIRSVFLLAFGLSPFLTTEAFAAQIAEGCPASAYGRWKPFMNFARSNMGDLQIDPQRLEFGKLGTFSYVPGRRAGGTMIYKTLKPVDPKTNYGRPGYRYFVIQYPVPDQSKLAPAYRCMLRLVSCVSDADAEGFVQGKSGMTCKKTTFSPASDVRRGGDY